MHGDKKILFIYSTKGGVGKSTVSTLLALSIAESKRSVTLLDLDITGPNISTHFSTTDSIHLVDVRDFSLVPREVSKYFKILTLGDLVSHNDWIYYEGKYLEGLLNQLLVENKSIESEYIIVDMPPGFSALHGYVFSQLSGSLVWIMTPNTVATDNMLRGRTLLKNLPQIKDMGVIMNMTQFHCSKCDNIESIFNANDSKVLKNYNILGNLPYSKEVHTLLNQGKGTDVVNSMIMEKIFYIESKIAKQLSIYGNSGKTN